MDIAGNCLLVMYSRLLDFGWKDYITSPCNISIFSHYQSYNLTQILKTKMLQLNPRQGVKEMIVACCNHVSPIKSSEFG